MEGSDCLSTIERLIKNHPSLILPCHPITQSPHLPLSTVLLIPFLFHLPLSKNPYFLRFFNRLTALVDVELLVDVPQDQAKIIMYM